MLRLLADFRSKMLLRRLTKVENKITDVKTELTVLRTQLVPLQSVPNPQGKQIVTGLIEDAARRLYLLQIEQRELCQKIGTGIAA